LFVGGSSVWKTRLDKYAENEKRICFCVDLFHHYLDPIKATSHGDLNAVGETVAKALVDNTIGRGKECKDARDEMALTVIQTVGPVMEVF
jgi:hypothetical protein